MGRGRRRTVKALVALGSVLAFLSVFAIWVERQALDTDDWVSTSGRLLENEEIRTKLADYLVDQLYENVDVEKELKEILPGETKEFSGPLSGGLRQVAGDGAERVLETSTAQGLWEKANRSTHEQLVEVLEEKGDTVSTEGGEVKLNLGALITIAAAAPWLMTCRQEVVVAISSRLPTAGSGGMPPPVSASQRSWHLWR